MGQFTVYRVSNLLWVGPMGLEMDSYRPNLAHGEYKILNPNFHLLDS